MTPQYQIIAEDDLKQSHLEKFDMELVGLNRLAIASASRYGAELRAAIGAGWIVSPETGKRTIEENGKKRTEYLFDGVPVEDLKPSLVWKIGKELDALYEQAITIDPN